MSCNIMNEYTDFTVKSFKKYFKKILEKYYDEQVFKSLIEVYINARYYNLYKSTSNSFENNIDYYLREKTCQLLDKNDNERKEEKIKHIFYLFRYMLYFDDVKKCESIKNIVDAIEGFRTKKLKLLNNEEFRNELLIMIKENNKAKEDFISKFDCKDFNLNYAKTNINGLFDVSITYDLNFSKLYSDYAINKVFTTGIINEHKLFIEYYLVLINMLKNIKNSDFSKNYLLDFSVSLFEKKEKINRILEILNNDFVKEKVSLKISYGEYKKNKQKIYVLTKEGYNIAIILDDTYDDNDVDREKLVIFKYILINKSFKYLRSFKNNKKVIIMN